jgi:hypothetical protein
MPNHEHFLNSTRLTILEGGKVDVYYFSPEEIYKYKWDGKKNWPRIDTSRPVVQDESEDLLKDVVKNLTKKIFFDEKKENKNHHVSNYGDEFLIEDDLSKEKEQLSDIEELEKKLNEYIVNKNFKKAEEVRNEIKRKREFED